MIKSKEVNRKTRELISFTENLKNKKWRKMFFEIHSQRNY